MGGMGSFLERIEINIKKMLVLLKVKDGFLCG